MTGAKTYKGKPTGGLERNLSTGTMMKSAIYYDVRGRIIKSYVQNVFNNVDEITNTYYSDVSGLVTSVVTKHNKSGTITTLTEGFTYDHMDRMLTHTMKINTGAVITLVSNEYNDLGQLVTKNLHSESGSFPIQQVDLRYNELGVLNKINDISDMGKDKFAMDISFTGDHNNGNVSRIDWMNTTGTFANSVQSYDFSYDGVNRLLSADYEGGSDDLFSVDNVSYDLNGNIQSLRRRYNYSIVDNLDYTYGSGNRLQSVTDLSMNTALFSDGNTSGSDYLYDRNGNMSADKNKGITNIDYNHLNLPDLVQLSGSKSLTYQYSASGSKLKKTIVDGSTTTEDYAGAFQYKNGAVNFIKHPYGRIRKNGSSWEYEYNLTDHLGNVRVVVEPASVASTTTYTYGFETGDPAANPDFSPATYSTSVKRNGSRSISLTGLGNVSEASFSVTEGQVVDVSTYCQGTGNVKLFLEVGGFSTQLATAGVIANGSNWQLITVASQTIPSDGTLIVQLNSFKGTSLIYYDDLTVGISDIDRAAVAEQHDYYPFGLTFNDLNGSNPTPYKYNGMEQEQLTKWYDYGARMYDAEIARWHVVDPLAGEMKGFSPYNYAFNNPLRFIDPDGMSPKDALFDKEELMPRNNPASSKDNNVSGFTISGMKGGGSFSFGSPGTIYTQKVTTTTTLTSSVDGEEVGSRSMEEVSYEIVAGDGTGNGQPSGGSFGDKLAMGTLAWISTDFVTPDPTDAAWLKWAGYAVAGTAAAVYLANNNSNNNFFYVTYTKINPTTGQVYVGRSSGYGDPYSVVRERDSNHHMNSLGYGPAVLSSSARALVSGGYGSRVADPSYWYIRGSEQVQIEYYRSQGISGNRYNGIGPTNRNLRKYWDSFTKYKF